MFKKTNAFTLIEMLVVAVIVSILLAIAVPALVAARSTARGVLCRSNLRQLVLANTGYSENNDGFCVPAAEDLWDGSGGLHRWHGTRKTKDHPFDPNGSPLVDYLVEGRLKECPQRIDFVKGKSWTQNFEQGCGGYGYNMLYIGSRLACPNLTFEDHYCLTPRITEISSPQNTVMFADCAMSKEPGRYIEYSFAEPPYFLINGKIYTKMLASPSIHFRHSDRANIAFSDAHVEPKEMAVLDQPNAYDIQSAKMNLGWFEPVDNTPFDLD